MFTRSARLQILVAALLFTSTITGCGDSVEVPKTVSATGKVTYKGQPLADAEVGFVSKLDNKDVKAARGVTDSNGEFSLTTYVDPQHEVSGATPGDYVVTVTKNEQIDPDEAMRMFQQNPMMEFKKLVPDKYTTKEASPLKASVTPDGENHFEFPLED